MVVVTVLLAVVAVAALVAAVIGFSRARRAEAEVAAGSKRVGDLVPRVGDLEATVKARDDELTHARGELDAARQEVASTGERHEALRKAADEQAVRADGAEAHVTELTRQVELLEAEIMTATEAKVAADAASRRSGGGGGDHAAGADQAPGPGAASPEALWQLELARTERLWRTSVAVVPDETSPIATADDQLLAALGVELAAAREEAGVEVDLEIDLPRRLDPPEALAVLRAAQELLPVAVRAGHATTLWVAAAGDDVIVEVSSLDDEGAPIEVDVPDLPPGRLVAQTGGIRLVGFLA